MKIWHISDTHGFHDLLEVPENVDIVIHSGDCSNFWDSTRNESEVRKFITWFDSLNIKHKIYVAGNHDTSIERGLITEYNFTDLGIHYLNNEAIEIDGINIYGSPYTPTFGDWAFMMARHKINKVWSIIPDDVDILITHGPPQGVLDLTTDRGGRYYQCGCSSLMNRIKEISPKFHMFGHIHNDNKCINAGVVSLPNIDTVFSNGSVVTDRQFGKVTSHGNIFEI